MLANGSDPSLSHRATPVEVVGEVVEVLEAAKAGLLEFVDLDAMEDQPATPSPGQPGPSAPDPQPAPVHPADADPSDPFFESEADASDRGYKLRDGLYLKPNRWNEVVADVSHLTKFSNGAITHITNLSDSLGEFVTIFEVHGEWYIADVKPGRPVEASFHDAESLVLPTYGKADSRYLTPTTTTHRFSSATPKSVKALDASRQVNLGSTYSVKYRSYTWRFDALDSLLLANIRLMTGMTKFPEAFIKARWPYGDAVLVADEFGAVIAMAQNSGGYALTKNTHAVYVDGDVHIKVCTGYDDPADKIGWISIEGAGPTPVRLLTHDKAWHNQRSDIFLTTSGQDGAVYSTDGNLLAVIPKQVVFDSEGSEVSTYYTVASEDNVTSVAIEHVDYIMEALSRYTDVPVRVKDRLVEALSIGGFPVALQVVPQAELDDLFAKKATKTVKELRDRIASLEGSVQRLEQTLRSTEVELNAQRALVSDANSARDLATSQLQQAESELATTRSELEAARAEIASLRKTVRDLTAGSDASATLTVRIKELEAQLQMVNDQLAASQRAAQAAADAALARQQEARATIDELRISNQQLAVQLAATREQLTESQRRSDTAANEALSLAKKVKELEAKLANSPSTPVTPQTVGVPAAVTGAGVGLGFLAGAAIFGSRRKDKER